MHSVERRLRVVPETVEAENVDDWLTLRDEDERVYRIKANLKGKLLPLVGVVDDYNMDLIEGLKSGWLTEEGALTDNGQAELRRRKEVGMVAQEQGRQKLLKALERRRRLQESMDQGTPVQRVDALMNKYGHEGSWRLIKREGGNQYELIFLDNYDQVEAGKVLSGSIKEVLSKLDRYLGSVQRMRK